MVDFVEICNVSVRKAIIEAAKRIINFDKVCRSYSDLNFGVTFLEHSVYYGLKAFPISQIKSLDFVLNSVVRKIFLMKAYDAVSEYITFFNYSVYDAIYEY